jgi:hypothetical protein
MNTLSLIASALDALKIPYLIGGSIASGVHGIGRTTFDVDIVAQITPRQADALAAALGKEWYVDTETARIGIPSGRAFNIVHMKSGDKFDIFPATAEFQASQLARAVKTPVEMYGDSVECPVATAEDILLAKLQWYQSGGEVSERQWADIRGILANNPELDFAYAQRWAAEIGVSRLLARAIDESRAGQETDGSTGAPTSRS